MSEIDLQQFIQGGGIGISILLILYSGWKDKLFNKTLNNHLQHFTEAIDRNTCVIKKNAEMNGKISQTYQSISRVLDRVENKLDKL